MAVIPFKPPAAGEPDPLAQEAQRRIQRAKVDRARHEGRIADCNKFALPWRHKFGAAQPSDELDNLYDPTAMNVLEDFASDNLNTFTPRRSHWLDIKPVRLLDTGQQRMIADALKAYQDTVFEEMARSNVYQCLQESYLDLGIGTMAGLIQDIDPAEPIFCQAIPTQELLLDRGPRAGVDLRAREWKVRTEEIPVLWPGAVMPTEMAERPKGGDATEWDIVDGMWRVWVDRSAEVWQYFVLCGGKTIFAEEYRGRGSCPMYVARWSRDPTTAYGVGPTYRCLPDIKTLNHVKFLQLKNLDKLVDPSMSYEDDGVTNIDQGVDPGTWVPRAVGSKAPEAMESKSKFDVSWVQADDLISSIKRAHYQDEPNQRGRTPPTAEQWRDEAMRRMRRMGTPAANLVEELQYPIVTRFGYLLARRGRLPKVELNGNEVALSPISPLLRAQEMEDVVRADQTLERFAALFGPQALNVAVKQIDYLNWVGERTGFPRQTIRTEQEIAGAIETFAPILGGGGGPSPGGAPSPSAPSPGA